MKSDKKDAHSADVFNVWLSRMSHPQRPMRSEPQVLAINNKASIIEVKTDFRYIVNLRPVQQNIVTGLGTQVPNVATYLPVPGKEDIGFMLEVTPSVGRSGGQVRLTVSF